MRILYNLAVGFMVISVCFTQQNVIGADAQSVLGDLSCSGDEGITTDSIDRFDYLHNPNASSPTQPEAYLLDRSNPWKLDLPSTKRLQPPNKPVVHKGVRTPTIESLSHLNYSMSEKLSKRATEISLEGVQSPSPVMEKDYGEVLKGYHKAANQGDYVAQGLLGAIYYSGQGVPKDYSEALRWFRKAADQGDAQAQAQLGLMYYEGKGVSKNLIEAKNWYRKAASQGDEIALKMLKKLTDMGF
jgi:hypothetical protein